MSGPDCTIVSVSPLVERRCDELTGAERLALVSTLRLPTAHLALLSALPLRHRLQNVKPSNDLKHNGASQALVQIATYSGQTAAESKRTAVVCVAPSSNDETTTADLKELVKQAMESTASAAREFIGDVVLLIFTINAPPGKQVHRIYIQEYHPISRATFDKCGHSERLWDSVPLACAVRSTIEVRHES